MTDAKNKTSIATPGPTSEKTEATPALDLAAVLRRAKETYDQVPEFLAREEDLWAFNQELIRQTVAALEQHANVPAILAMRRLGEGLNSIVGESAEAALDFAQRLLQSSKDYAEQAAEENDPEMKRRLSALSEKSASYAASTKKEAEKLMQRVSARKEELAAVTASLPKNDAD